MTETPGGYLGHRDVGGGTHSDVVEVTVAEHERDDGHIGRNGDDVGESIGGMRTMLRITRPLRRGRDVRRSR